MADNVRVAVRVRPFNAREVAAGSRNIITINKALQQTIIENPETGEKKDFTFDFSYNSHVPRDDPEYASQTTVWEDLGVSVLDCAWNGFNVSLFAYGQVGAGTCCGMFSAPGL